MSVVTLRARVAPPRHHAERYFLVCGGSGHHFGALIYSRYDPFKTRDYSGGGNGGPTVTLSRFVSLASPPRRWAELEAAGVIAMLISL